MKNDKRGIGGFMESMAAAMIVVISLTAFMGLFGYIQSSENECGDDYGFIETLRMENGMITGDIHDDIVYLVESKGYVGMRVNVDVIGGVSEASYSDSFGTMCSEEITSDFGSFEMSSDDGRVLIANYEVVVWH